MAALTLQAGKIFLLTLAYVSQTNVQLLWRYVVHRYFSRVFIFPLVLYIKILFLLSFSSIELRVSTFSNWKLWPVISLFRSYYLTKQNKNFANNKVLCCWLWKQGMCLKIIILAENICIQKYIYTCIHINLYTWLENIIFDPNNFDFLLFVVSTWNHTSECNVITSDSVNSSHSSRNYICY